VIVFVNDGCYINKTTVNNIKHTVFMYSYFTIREKVFFQFAGPMLRDFPPTFFSINQPLSTMGHGNSFCQISRRNRKDRKSRDAAPFIAFVFDDKLW
jgi:hypothetical protein